MQGKQNAHFSSLSNHGHVDGILLRKRIWRTRGMGMGWREIIRGGGGGGGGGYCKFGILAVNGWVGNWASKYAL